MSIGDEPAVHDEFVDFVLCYLIALFSGKRWISLIKETKNPINNCLISNILFAHSTNGVPSLRKSR